MTDHGNDPVMLYSIATITICYWIFAIQMLWQTPRGAWRKKGPRAVLALVVVFSLCAFAGYLSTLLPESWYEVRAFVHVLLALASVWLVLTNQSRFIANMLAGNHDLD